MFTLTCDVRRPTHVHFPMEVGTITQLHSKTQCFSSSFGSTSYITIQDNCTNLEWCDAYMIPRSREIAHVQSTFKYHIRFIIRLREFWDFEHQIQALCPWNSRAHSRPPHQLSSVTPSHTYCFWTSCLSIPIWESPKQKVRMHLDNVTSYDIFQVSNHSSTLESGSWVSIVNEL